MKEHIESLEGDLQKAVCRSEETERGRQAAEAGATDSQARVKALEAEVQTNPPTHSKQPYPPISAKILKP